MDSVLQIRGSGFIEMGAGGKKAMHDLPQRIVEGLRELLQVVGQVAVTRHMVQTTGAQNNFGVAVNPTMLTMRTRRLAMSLIARSRGSKLMNSAEGGVQMSADAGLNVSGKLYTRVPYAGIHEFGGVIVPKKAKFLSWVGADGKRVFARKVTMRARPFLGPATKDNVTKQAIPNIFGKKLTNSIQVIVSDNAGNLSA